MSRRRVRKLPIRRRFRTDNTLCPACGSRAQMIRTEQLTNEIRHKTYLCENEECQGEFITSIAFVRWVYKRKK